MRFIRRLCIGFLCLMAVNPVIVWTILNRAAGSVLFASVPVAALLCFWIFINFMPFKDKNYMGLRLIIMMGGRTLCYIALFGILAQCGISIWMNTALRRYGMTVRSLIANGIFAYILWFVMLWNGIIRIFFTSKRLSVKVRILLVFVMWVPLVNLFALLYALRLVHAEYDFACYKEAVRSVRADSVICETKYPIIMVHGVGFRDLKYFNYWGRIPRELTRLGADIYYGSQEAFGTVVYNADDIKKKINQVLEKTGKDKVNLIAHSKGGLDARYTISKLNMGEYVASLTTICTPHRGCRFVDYACRLPDGLYHFIAKLFDSGFRRIGDKNPDFYTATRQFSTQASLKFNKEVEDVPGIYYQSYASKMKNCFSDMLLSIPYCLIKPLEGENDGLVSVTSAMWGNYRGVIFNRYQRGISHGDMIDLKREDYRGIDIVEEYVKIVSDLKEKGF